MSRQQRQRQRQPSAWEVRCKTHFDAWLCQRDSDAVITWDFEPCGHTKAPDYLLTLNGRDFAVEVAAVMRREVLDGEYVSEYDVVLPVNRFLKDIEANCKQKGLLSGAYAVTVDRAIQDYPLNRKGIQAQIVDYISRTHDDDTAVPETIRVGATANWTIVKGHNQADYIGPVKLVGERATTDSDVENDLCDILKKEIDDKIGKLQHINLPHILLLEDDFELASPYVWLDCLNSYAPTKTFHTIFVVVPHKLDFIVYSQEVEWPALDRQSDYAQFG